VFAKTSSALGGRVRGIVSGAAPLARHVEDFLKATMGCPIMQARAAIAPRPRLRFPANGIIESPTPLALRAPLCLPVAACQATCGAPAAPQAWRWRALGMLSHGCAATISLSADVS
jgi:hypothetical protein